MLDNKSRRSAKCFISAALLLLAAASTPAADRGWSIDLRKHGYAVRRDARGWQSSTRLGFAVTNEAVAVALANPATNETAEPQSPLGSWEISILIFDLGKGKLVAQCGPWRGDSLFELHSNSHGNLLLLTRDLHDSAGESGETLYLLSPAGQELKRIVFPSSLIRDKPAPGSFFLSPSGRTILFTQVLPDGPHHRLLDANSLDEKSSWTVEAGSHSPAILALSDRQFLGVTPSTDPKKSHGMLDGQLYVRDFGGPWNSFSATLDLANQTPTLGFHLNQLAFLSDDTIVALEGDWRAHEHTLGVFRSDGSKIRSLEPPNVPSNTRLSGPVTVSRDGQFFAAAFSHRPALSHLMLDVWHLDDTFEDDELLLSIWAASSQRAVAKADLGRVHEVRAFALPSGEPAKVAVLGQGWLKVVEVQKLP